MNERKKAAVHRAMDRILDEGREVIAIISEDKTSISISYGSRESIPRCLEFLQQYVEEGPDREEIIDNRLG